MDIKLSNVEVLMSRMQYETAVRVYLLVFGDGFLPRSLNFHWLHLDAKYQNLMYKHEVILDL